MQGVLILVSLVRVERLDEDAERIHVCLSHARKFRTSLGTMEIHKTYVSVCMHMCGRF